MYSDSPHLTCGAQLVEWWCGTAWKVPEGQAWQMLASSLRNCPTSHCVCVVVVPLVCVVAVVVEVFVPVVAVTDVIVDVLVVSVTVWDVVVVVQWPSAYDPGVSSHSKHSRSEVAVAATATYSPCPQLLSGVHWRLNLPGIGALVSNSEAGHESAIVSQTKFRIRVG